jgi:hypothetical protein
VAGAAGSYPVTFTESGLASGTSWSVTFNAVPASSTTATIVFTAVASGTYTYTSGVVSNYTASPSSGSVVVNGTAANQAIMFTSSTGGSGGGAAGTPVWVWPVIAIVVVGAIVAGAAIALSRRKKESSK